MAKQRPPWISGPMVATRAWRLKAPADPSSEPSRPASVDRTLHDDLAEVHGGAPAGRVRRWRHLVEGCIARGHVLFRLEEDQRVGGAARAVADDDDPLRRDPRGRAIPALDLRLDCVEALRVGTLELCDSRVHLSSFDRLLPEPISPPS